MELVKMILAAIFGFGGFLACLVILVHAFKDEIWKGLLCLFCGPYWLYYSIFDFEHEKKWPIVLLALLGTIIAALIMMI
jgi:hypothetical protein